LLPVPPSTCAEADLEAGHWFRCQLCNTLQETARLLQHVAEQHQHLMAESDPARAAACCISRSDFLQYYIQCIQTAERCLRNLQDTHFGNMHSK
jgi:hypothetical protein